ncbi:MAG: hypothetical protein J0L69_04745 [Bacteroidetes bacterium]|nr:hypothetical protein [Bacteroidota bacterium]
MTVKLNSATLIKSVSEKIAANNSSNTTNEYLLFKEFILSIEQNFPVNSWTFNSIHLWPLIRIRLFFYLVDYTHELNKKLIVDCNQNQTDDHHSSHLNHKPVQNRVDIKKFARLKDLISKLKSTLNYYRLKKRIKSKSYLFVGHNEHRINYKSSLYNRFFDTIIDENNLHDKSYVIEFGERKTESLANSRIIINPKEFLKKYTEFYFLKQQYIKLKANVVKLDDYDKFISFLLSNNVTSVFAENYSEAKVRSLVNYTLAVEFDFYTELLKKINPKKLFVLCYYNDLSLIAAANKLNIETIEMQHGAQVDEHLAYGNWSVVPEEGYDYIPRKYWCWDIHSSKVLDCLTSQNKLYNAFVGGHVWVDYWLQKNEKYLEDDFILYTLQPDCFSIEQLFPQAIISFIKNESKKWFIRLHPRQLKELKAIKAYLETLNILSKINIEEATKDPLPMLLRSCCIHITNHSSTTIEAALFNKKTVLIHETGKLYYSDIVAEGKAEYIPVNENFEAQLKKQLSMASTAAYRSIEKPFYIKYFT